MQKYLTQSPHQRGFTLLIAILVISIVLAIGLSVLNITLKEFILSGIARESTIALNAADAGMECALYWDRSSQGGRFNVGASGSNITCMGQSRPSGGGTSGTAQHFEFEWGQTPTLKVCAKVDVTKYLSASGDINMGGTCSGSPCICPEGVICTRTVSLGYNTGCSEVTSPRAVERGLRARY